MAEPMDLSDGGLALHALEWLFEGDPHPDANDSDVKALVRIFLAIRDAATAAERQRAIAIVESRLKDDGWNAHYKNAWVMILAALRGGA